MTHAAAASVRPRRNTPTSVCYRCEYTSLDATLTRCPLCGFAIILEAGGVSLFGGRVSAADTPASESGVVSLFGGDEATGPVAKVLRLPLPGLDAESVREQRRAMDRTRRRIRRQSSAGGTSLLAEQSGRPAWRGAGLAMAIVSAMIAGMLFVVLGAL